MTDNNSLGAESRAVAVAAIRGESALAKTALEARPHTHTYTRPRDRLRWKLDRAYPLILLAALDLSYTIYSTSSLPGSTSNSTAYTPSNTPASVQTHIPLRVLCITFARVSLLSYVGVSREWRRKGGYVGALCGVTLGQAVWEGCSGVLMRNGGAGAAEEGLTGDGAGARAGAGAEGGRGGGSSGGMVDNRYLVISMRLPTSQTHRTPSSVRFYSTGGTRNTPNTATGNYYSYSLSPSPATARVPGSAASRQKVHRRKGHSRHVSRATMRSMRSAKSAMAGPELGPDFGADTQIGHLLSPGQYQYGAIGETGDGTSQSPSRVPFGFKKDDGAMGPITSSYINRIKDVDAHAHAHAHIDTNTAEIDVFTSSAQPNFSPTHGLNRRSVDRFQTHTLAREPRAGDAALASGHVYQHGYRDDDDDDNDQQADHVEKYANDEHGDEYEYGERGEYGYGYDCEDGSGFEAVSQLSASFTSVHVNGHGHGYGRRRSMRSYGNEPSMNRNDGDEIDLDEFARGEEAEEEEELYDDDMDEEGDYSDENQGDSHDDDNGTGDECDDVGFSSSISESSIIDLPPPLSPAPLTVPTILPNVRFPRSTSLNIGLRSRARGNSSTRAEWDASPGHDDFDSEAGAGIIGGTGMGTGISAVGPPMVRKTKSGFLLGRSWSDILSLSPTKRTKKGSGTTIPRQEDRLETSIAPDDGTASGNGYGYRPPSNDTIDVERQGNSLDTNHQAREGQGGYGTFH
ncbi:hypothetical protein I316_01459 [Kwoniella heveanensis BCC8398]|uniref:Uncharacterized protein n=1 Tax=Kwoniella heveanensis BCC8398 TaxID=1296120 RepID=A0A1B9H0Q9_9TREE|nr:hypothetical protein I316_01459 [Kwoniella heveanensis BCC8398]